MGGLYSEDIKILECVKKRATNVLKGLEGMTYVEWLRLLAQLREG